MANLPANLPALLTKDVRGGLPDAINTLVDALKSPRERVSTARGWGRGSNTATSRNPS